MYIKLESIDKVFMYLNYHHVMCAELTNFLTKLIRSINLNHKVISRNVNVRTNRMLDRTSTAHPMQEILFLIIGPHQMFREISL